MHYLHVAHRMNALNGKVDLTLRLELQPPKIFIWFLQNVLLRSGL